MNIGFIGTGNMASAVIGGLLSRGIVAEKNLFVTDASEGALQKISSSYPEIHTSTDNRAFLPELDFLFLSVKPHIYAPVIAQIRDALPASTVVITIAAGQTREKVLKQFGREIKLVRTMPNTPALVGEGMTAVCPARLLRKRNSPGF